MHYIKHDRSQKFSFERIKKAVFTKENFFMVVFLGLLSVVVIGLYNWNISEAKKNIVRQLEESNHASLSSLTANKHELDQHIKEIDKEFNSKTSAYAKEQETVKAQTLETKASEDKVKTLTQNLADKNKKIADLKSELTKLSIPAGKFIDINLTTQTLIAFENEAIVKQYVISSGKPGRATPTGSYAITEKYPVRNYIGPDYYYPDTKWNMRYQGPYLIHSAYWHNDFGKPVSHGCINMKVDEAEWLYNWVKVGTPLKIHY
jgi:lipoprotein-anchoring transpeptidase ErfK/SrfK